ncbi:hypothetical protein QEN19_004385 [Hanseniaspora menglaensis]
MGSLPMKDSIKNETVNDIDISSNEKQLTLYQRMASATAGSFLTSFFLTPMDVVRVRLQQQEMVQQIQKTSCECETSMTTIKQPQSSSLIKHIFWEENCFSNLKCNDQKQFSSTFDAFKKITANEGFPTLWRGISLTLLMAIPANVIYYSGYESLRDISPLKHNFETVNALTCGAGARVIAATCIAPIELLRTRLQSIPAGQGVSSYTIIKDLLTETKKEFALIGYKSLFKGLEITLWRDVPFSAFYWASYESIKKNINFIETSTDNSKQGFFEHFTKSFIAGSISGTIAGIITHPFDVGKTRLQISMQEKKNGSSSLQRDHAASFKNNRNMFAYLNTIRKNEGVLALYAGITPRIIKIAPSCAIMISTYEIGKKLFS